MSFMGKHWWGLLFLNKASKNDGFGSSNKTCYPVLQTHTNRAYLPSSAWTLFQLQLITRHSTQMTMHHCPCFALSEARLIIDSSKMFLCKAFGLLLYKPQTKTVGLTLTNRRGSEYQERHIQRAETGTGIHVCSLPTLMFVRENTSDKWRTLWWNC